MRDELEKALKKHDAIMQWVKEGGLEKVPPEKLPKVLELISKMVELEKEFYERVKENLENELAKGNVKDPIGAMKMLAEWDDD